MTSSSRSLRIAIPFASASAKNVDLAIDRSITSRRTRCSPLRTPAMSCCGSAPFATRGARLFAPSGRPRSTSPRSLSTSAARSPTSCAARVRALLRLILARREGEGAHGQRPGELVHGGPHRTTVESGPPFGSFRSRGAGRPHQRPAPSQAGALRRARQDRRRRDGGRLRRPARRRRARRHQEDSRGVRAGTRTS